METPGHTADHISYFNQKVLFCGDTLFTGGCGRQLGGGYENFTHSLLKIRDLPEALEVYTAHEYTLDNLKFGHYICPENKELSARLAQFELPYPRIHHGAQSTLKLEKRTNPFLQFDQACLVSKLQTKGADPQSNTSLFKTLRLWKDEIDQQGFPNSDT